MNDINPISSESNTSRDILIFKFVFALLGVAAIIMIEWIRPEKDNLTLIGIVLTALYTIGKFNENIKKLDETHRLINSRMTEQLNMKDVAAEAAVIAARIMGIAEGREKERALTVQELMKAQDSARATIEAASTAAHDIKIEARDAAAALVQTAKEIREEGNK